MCIGSHATVLGWKSEDSFIESVPSSHLYKGSRDGTRFSVLHGQCLRLLSHLISSGLQTKVCEVAAGQQGDHFRWVCVLEGHVSLRFKDQPGNRSLSLPKQEKGTGAWGSSGYGDVLWEEEEITDEQRWPVINSDGISQVINVVYLSPENVHTPLQQTLGSYDPCLSQLNQFRVTSTKEVSLRVTYSGLLVRSGVILSLQIKSWRPRK